MSADHTNSVITDNCIIITKPNGVQTIVDPPDHGKMSPDSGRNSHVTFEIAPENTIEGDSEERDDGLGEMEDSMESGEAMVAHLPLRPRVQTYSSYQVRAIEDFSSLHSKVYFDLTMFCIDAS